MFRLALRQTEGLIGSVLQRLGLDLPVPDHSTLSRRAETLEVPRPRRGREPVHLLVDSTGLKLCGPGEWLVEKHGARTRRGWRKLHLATDAGTGHIVATVLTDKDADDGSQVGPLLDRVDGPVASVTGDGAFDRDDAYAEVAARHPEAAVVVPPRANAVPSAAAEAALHRNPDGSWTVTGPDGTDLLRSIEVLRFSDAQFLSDIEAARPRPNDVRGDGRSDVLWRGGGGEVAVWEMDIG